MIFGRGAKVTVASVASVAEHGSHSYSCPISRTKSPFPIHPSGREEAEDRDHDDDSDVPIAIRRIMTKRPPPECLTTK